MPSKFRYYLIDEFLNVTGTNSLEVAKVAFFAGALVVIDAHENVSFEDTDDLGDELEPTQMDIPEHCSDTPEAP